jgi:FkbM family methyltransferase
MLTYKNLLENLAKSYCRFSPLQKGKLRIANQVSDFCIGQGSEHRTAKLNCGYTIQCDLHKLLQRQYYFFGTYFTERLALKDWQGYAAKAQTIFDIGANLGIYSLEASAINPSARIFAIEPTPAIAQHLRQTCQSNKIANIEVIQKAMGSQATTIFLNFCGEDNEGMNFTTAVPRSANGLMVVQVTLDGLCKDNKIDTIELLKMDVQGNEADVLLGAQDLLRSKSIRCVFFEVNRIQSETGLNICPAASMLRDYGYRFRPAGHPSWELQENFEALGQFPDLVAII